MMVRSRSQAGSHLDALSGPVKGSTASPSRRRVTRSQSRELEETPTPQVNAPPNRSSRGGQKRWGQSNTLTPVVEESPVGSPRKHGYHYGNLVIPESPEDVANISGTTILPSEPETDLEPEMMLEALPDLERAGKSVLDFLVPSSSDPVSIINTAKRLGDPRNTQNRRLARLKSNLSGEAKYFGNQAYIDAKRVGRVFSSALANRHRGFEGRWSPSPILHLANCARFTSEILLASAGTNSQKQAIKNVESLFPLPFMDDLTSDRSKRANGKSSLAKDTFDLALEIRTQSLIMLLEDRQKDPEFSPMTAVRDSFFVDLSVDAPIRGFNLPGLRDEDGILPDMYKDIVQQRFDEILLSQMEDGSIDIDELKGAYRWQRFVLRAAQWARKRIKEIHRDLKQQMSAQDVHDAFFNAKPPSFDSTAGGSDSDAERSPVAEEPSPVVEETQRESAALLDRLSEASAARPVSKGQGQERRKSSKPSFLNTSSIQRMAQREERLRSVTANPENRRQSDIVRSSSQREREESTSERRRETLPASTAARQSVLEGPREIPPSPDVSQTLIHDEQEIYIGDETHLSTGENGGTQVERSHSPPVINRHSPHLLQKPQDTGAALSKRLWSIVSSAPSGNSRAAFIDRQANAERVSPISQVDSQNAVARVEGRVSRKRARLEEDEEESVVGEDFFNYDRPVDLERRRAEKPAQPGSKRQRLQADEEEEHEQSQVAEDDHHESPERPSSQIRRAPWVSTNAGRASTSLPQARKRWSAAEDQRLIRLIAEYGCAWSTIVGQNEAQPARDGEARIEGRTDVQLKDRARNLKIKFLRESQELPANFNGVTMKAKDYEMLEKRGIAVPPR